ncbi:Protein Brevis radix-like 4 [Zea mays]|uniref:Protein Brevis radix-like 4 n=1 Tax=Zea mays TaxID=4577 RepID=A0A1D6ER66_MAIZE|nr:Protein Brevis radix-like 4 [Zea mays]
MLTCIACSKQQFSGGGPPLHEPPEDDDVVGGGAGTSAGAATPSTRHAIKALTAQIKDMALKASGAYRQCKPCAGSSAAASRRHHPYHHRGGSAFGGSDADSGASDRFHYASSNNHVVICYFACNGVYASREMFNKWEAQRWWAENYDKVMELYNVQKFNQTVPLPATPKSEDESSKEDSPVTPPLDKERLPRTFHRQGGGAMGSSSSDSLEHHSNHYCTGRHHHHHHHGHQCCDSMGLASTPKLSSISGAKTETSSMDASMRTSSSPEEIDRSGELSVSVSNASDQEREWVEEDEPGVYITIRALPGGIRELRRVRFSREKFSEMHARLWWEENRARIHEQYL